MMYFLFGSLSFRYVLNYADKFGLSIRRNFADGKTDRKNRTALSLTLNFPADTDDLGIAGFKIVTNIVVVLASIGLGHQKRHILSENFLGTESKNDLRSRVEGLNSTPMINHNNGINSRVEQRFPFGCCIQMAVRRRPFRGTCHKYIPGYSYA